MPETRVSVRLGKETREDLKKLDKKIIDKLFDNLINPLLKGYLKDELEGKYKPSWEIPADNNNIFANAFAKEAQNNDLYHYHFGYPFYAEGRDPKYPGRVSEAIAHTIYKEVSLPSSEEQNHSIYHIDPTHPHPFRIPTNFNQDFISL